MPVPNKQVGLTEAAMAELWSDRLYLCRCDQCVRLAEFAMGADWTRQKINEISSTVMPRIRKKAT